MRRTLTTLTLALSLAACSGDGTGPGDDGDGNGSGNGDGNGNGGGSLPAELVGTWVNGSVSSVGWYNPSTGDWSSASGIGLWYELKADGTYSFGGASRIDDGMCTTWLTVWIEGNARAENGRLTFDPERGKTRLEDSCDDEVTERTPNMETSTYDYGFETIEGTEFLALTDDEGATIRYAQE